MYEVVGLALITLFISHDIPLCNFWEWSMNMNPTVIYQTPEIETKNHSKPGTLKSL